MFWECNKHNGRHQAIVKSIKLHIDSNYTSFIKEQSNLSQFAMISLFISKKFYNKHLISSSSNIIWPQHISPHLIY